MRKRLLAGEKIAGKIDIVHAAHIGIREIEPEGVVDDIEDAVHGYHDEHADESPHHVPLAFRCVAFPVYLPEKLDKPVDEEQEAEREYDKKRGVNDVRDDALHCVTGS